MIERTLLLTSKEEFLEFTPRIILLSSLFVISERLEMLGRMKSF